MGKTERKRGTKGEKSEGATEKGRSGGATKEGGNGSEHEEVTKTYD